MKNSSQLLRPKIFHLGNGFFYTPYLTLILAFSFFVACSNKENPDQLFQLLSPNQTGLNFKNEIQIDEDFNILDFDYIYNGGGVAVGDFNNDGLPDIFFAGNQVSSKLYLNDGNMKFRDISKASNISTKSWAEGATLIDINNDGLLDIYVSVSNRDESNPDPNLLFVNQGINEDGIPVFEEMAAAYGIDDRGYNTQAAFFDYDKDGFLDLYILSNALEAFQRNTSRPREMTGRGKSNDKLYKNNGDGTFTEVTKEAGILIEGYGLGLAISDINQDGYPDIYVANDFITNDILYINNGDGTFTNKIDEMLKHQSFNAMGVDIADYNNDGLVDIMVLDMLPPDNYRQKTMFAPTENYDLYMSNLSKGYEPQYVKNTLQLNRGNGKFSEIAHLAGVAQTDWSWAPLFFDMDNDGQKDLFISNGYGKDITDLDHINFTQSFGPFTSPEERRAMLLDALSNLDEVSLPNYVFRNKGNLLFEDKSKEWGMLHASISNGAAFADFDNDGDLDLVINNFNDEAYLYHNKTREKQPGEAAYLKIRLEGQENNRMGLGTFLELSYESKGKEIRQFYEHYPTRGYKSFVEPMAFFGLGKDPVNTKLKVTWPDGKVQQLDKLPQDTVLTIAYSESYENPREENEKMEPEFLEVSEEIGLIHSHQHRTFNDFNRQVLLPHKHSENGPGMAVGDVTGNGLDDLFVGGSAGFPRVLFLQNAGGNFQKKELFEEEQADDMGCLLIDLDGDGDLDLYVVSGGSRYVLGHEAYQDRVYWNDGKGNFKKAEGVLPEMRNSGSVVTAADIDGDGQMELFVGGRISPGRYPETPESYLLKFNGEKFEDISGDFLPDQGKLGMVTSALWTDFDNDGLVDLIVLGEWMPVTFLKQMRSNNKIKFSKVNKELGPKFSNGWWNSIVQVGQQEYILGNLGRNNRWNVNKNTPMKMFAADFDGNGSIDPIIFSHQLDGHYPIASRNMLVAQVPRWKNRFLKFSGYANTQLDDFFNTDLPEDTTQDTAYIHDNVYMYLGTEGKFELEPLPVVAQFAPIYGVHFDNFTGKAMGIGNFYGNETVTGRYDASYGTLLEKNGKGSWTTNHLAGSGFLVEGEGRSLVELQRAEGAALFVAAQHRGKLKSFLRSKPLETLGYVVLEQDDFIICFGQGQEQPTCFEMPYGSGYLSQSTRKVQIPSNCTSVTIKKYSGEERQIAFE
ncbi:VCBS repeat-containing protein [Arthrospiribacter ruber]|uniref:ASPIC/UnbV domain-containing protein n=1 Tax=Arthrospiribacter ruber TaxID=2487934 RepID=A0A951IYV1_9BACT|nr:VCBS repeat-containing protein [Arthrospiribacter ruber]MBW3468407.1 hypothetical protein [Arthrospiribacter ruber]